ncbi:MAG: class III extradiol ring-cleavage dioxygenase [Leptothrix ochracea]|uniref:DODA-type extradiol aromatic ring-opening family dioxygenase n=1 Tax=Leptothrix ochracea TaxID=735331 RepID=UPI0034E30192
MSTSAYPSRLPSLFVSHGSPMIALETTPAAFFLDRLGPAIERLWGRPRAVLMCSPHSPARQPLVLGAARHSAIHDFGGFPAELYQLRYDALGEPLVAQEAAELIKAAGLGGWVTETSGLDHGLWTVLRRMWPDAGVPVVPLALVPSRSPAEQWALGAALAPLAEQGVLIIGSGAATHHLGRYPWGRDASQEPVAPDVRAWQDWIAARVQERDWPALLDYRRRAPEAALQHPTDEHWLPFYIAAGAGSAGRVAGSEIVGQRLHASVDAGVLAMDAYAFGAGAAELAKEIA